MMKIIDFLKNPNINWKTTTHQEYLAPGLTLLPESSPLGVSQGKEEEGLYLKVSLFHPIIAVNIKYLNNKILGN